MRIGILTLPIGHNFGGILQAYALQKTLTLMGHQTKVINWDRSPRKKVILYYPFRFLRKYIGGDPRPIRHEKLEYEAYIRNYSENDIFIKKYIPCRVLKKIKEIGSKEFDMVVIGSDQIWRPVYCRYPYGVENAFGNFAFIRKWKVISYAASFGIDTLKEFTPQELAIIKKLIRKFKALSVREDSGVTLCRNLGVQAEHVLDPTLLLTRKDYECLIPETIKRRRGIMTYILDPIETKQRIIDQFCNLFKKETFSTNPEHTNDNSVMSWLAGFRDADFIITDSFHACVFSIIFNKPFAVLPNEGRGQSRILSLLKAFDLEHNLINNFEEIHNEKYYGISESTNEYWLTQKERSLNFLSEALK